MMLPTCIADRWAGRTSIQRLMWRDLLGVGTFVNMLFGFTALILLAKKWDAYWSVAIHMVLFPYNLFLVTCVWRHPDASSLSKGCVLVWLLVFLMA